jgi:hypothetical protein
MTASYGIITGVDNTVTAVVARCHIFIIFRLRAALCRKPRFGCSGDEVRQGSD